MITTSRTFSVGDLIHTRVMDVDVDANEPVAEPAEEPVAVSTAEPAGANPTEAEMEEEGEDEDEDDGDEAEASIESDSESLGPQQRGVGTAAKAKPFTVAQIARLKAKCPWFDYDATTGLSSCMACSTCSACVASKKCQMAGDGVAVDSGHVASRLSRVLRYDSEPIAVVVNIKYVV
jgi:hypothetical protein